MATVYAIASAKGGVGKTTTTAAVATLLAESGADVVAIDADIGMANLADALGVTPGETTVHDVLAGDADPEAAVHEGPDGLRVVPGETAIDAYAAADPSKLRAVVEAFADADYVFLDAGAGLSHDSTLPLGLADETLLVSTRERSALGDTEKTRQLVERLGGSVAGAVLTRVDARDLDDGHEAEIVADILNADVLGRIPEDPAILRASTAGEPVVSTEPNAPASHAYRDLVRALTGATIDDPEPVEGVDDPGNDDDPAEDVDDTVEGADDPRDDDDLIVADTGPAGMGEAGDEEEIIVADEQPIEGDSDETDAVSETDDADETEADGADDGRTEADGADDDRTEADEADDDESGDGEEKHTIDDEGDQPADPPSENPVTETIPDAEGRDAEPDSDRNLVAGGGVDAESAEDADAGTETGADSNATDPDVDEELAGSVPFRDDDTGTETPLSRTDEDEPETDGTEGDTDGAEGMEDEEDDEKGGFFSRLLGR